MVIRLGLVLAVFESVDPDLLCKIFTFHMVDLCVCIYGIYQVINLLLNKFCFKNSCDAFSMF